MSEDDALVRQENRPRLVAAARGLMVKRVTETPEIGRALDAARNAKGIVVSSHAEAVALADTARAIQKAGRALDEQAKEVGEVAHLMLNAVKECVAPLRAVLIAGKKACDDATLAWDAQCRREEAERRRKLELEAAAVAQRAIEEARAMGLDEDEIVPLEADLSIAETPKVKGGSGHQVITETLCCELVDASAADPAWLTLREADAKAWFRLQVQRGDAEKPTPEKPIIERGVKFFVRRGVTTRGAS